MRIRLMWFFAALMLWAGCSQGTQPGGDDTGDVLTYSDEGKTDSMTGTITLKKGKLSVTLNRLLQYKDESGQVIWYVEGRTNKNIKEIITTDQNGPFGQGIRLTSQKFQIVLDESELKTVLSGSPVYVELKLTDQTLPAYYLAVYPGARLGDFSGSSYITFWQFLAPIWKDGTVAFLGTGTTSQGYTPSRMETISGDMDPVSEEMTPVDGTQIQFVWTFQQIIDLLYPEQSTVRLIATKAGKELTKTGRLGLVLKKAAISTTPAIQAWPSATCMDETETCLGKLPQGTTDARSCGSYIEVQACGGIPGSIPTGEVSELFPEESQFIDPLGMAWFPPETDQGDVEENAHVLSYKTADGRHYCELWWMGGDGGTPILSYLVDTEGAHYLPPLSQPKLGGEKPYKTLEEAKETFIQLAENYYGAADGAREFFSSFDFLNTSFAETSLPNGSRIDARPGYPDRATIPAQVLQAFDFYYRVEDADWGSVSLHQGIVGAYEVYAVYTSTDGDDAWLEVFWKSGTPLVSARLWASEILGWDEFFGRTRLSTGLESLWNLTSTEGLSTDEERAAAGQIPLDWTPDVRIEEGKLHHHSGRLTTIDFAADLQLSAEQRVLAYAAFELLWNRGLCNLANGDEPLQIGPDDRGVLLLGTFTNSVDGKTYLVADWIDIDDSSYTFYFERNNDILQPVIEQFNN